MDWTALKLSLELGGLTVLALLPIGVIVGRWLAYAHFVGKDLVEAVVALPLVLPPTVFGYYLLVAFGKASPIGQMWEAVTGHQLVFTFEGLLIASIIFNVPFAIQPMQRSFEAIAPEIREAASCCGMGWWETLRRIELPLAWPGILTAMVLSFAHTLGEFGIVLMVGGSIPGETKTIAISIYDRVQAFDDASAWTMSLVLLAISLVTIAFTYAASRRIGRRLG
jgi:molybdate transport system permease protein